MKNKKNNNAKNNQNAVQNIAKTIKEEGKKGIFSDVNGSYTGMDYDNENPVQDADDL